MAYGNQNTQGNKGYNDPWQRAMLELLKDIKANTASGGGTPITLTPDVLRTSGAATISGAKSVSIYNSGAANGTVLGAVLEPGEILTWEVGQDINTIGDIAYDASGTEFLINTLS